MNTEYITYRIPSSVFVLRDEPVPPLRTAEIEMYLSEAYYLLLTTLARLVHKPNLSNAEEHQLRSLLDEVLSTKRILDERV